VLNARRILADEDAAEFVHRHLDRAGTAFKHRLTPADNAGVGVDFQKQPAWPDVKGFELGDFHKISGLRAFAHGWDGSPHFTHCARRACGGILHG
jgi:hypothetical protein